jgi:phospholipid/cholesterol/gamma-HCH transport system permease protein
MLAIIGQNTLKRLQGIGEIFMFLYKTTIYSFTPKWYFREFFSQCFKIGFLSLPVVGMTAIFTGGVIALQTYIGAARYNVADTVPSLVVLTITRELGPVLTALMVAGRISSAIAAELGTMKVTEQIDALKTLSTNPIQYLVVPRLFATLICMPILVLIADIIGIYGGYLTSVYSLGFNSTIYIIKTINFMTYNDVFSGITKAILFGFLVAFIGCYSGYNSGKGAEGVGKATTNAVVLASILIFLFDFILTKLFFV